MINAEANRHLQLSTSSGYYSTQLIGTHSSNVLIMTVLTSLH
jgi:hypothetical protein